jgi:hypothetical protein
LFYAVRSWLPSDALVDLSQIGLGVAGSLAIAHVGVSLGASAGVALAAGAAWLTFPAVFLQLPTNYVDVGVAAFLLLALALLAFAPVTRRHLVVGGVALGLYLGSKPNAVVPAALIGGLALFRAVRAQRGAWIVATAALALLLGANKYVANFVRFGNPVWPLAVHLGPWHPPGFIEVKTLLASGARAPRPPAGPLPFRALWSWLSFPGHLVYDTRKGGLGPLFGLFVLPGVVVALVRRAWPLGLGISLGVAALVTLFHPEPSTPRFVLAWFGLAAALAARAGDRLGGRIRVAVFSAAALAALVGLAFAVRGLTGEGPPLLEVARLAPEARIRALNPNGAAAAWQDFESHLRPDDVVAFDESLSMPYLLWRPDLANRVVPLAWRESTAAVAAVLAAEKVTYLVAGDKLPASELAATQPSRFRPLFRCGADPCTVYQIVEP